MAEAVVEEQGEGEQGRRTVVRRAVGLALRAHRRVLGQSQRAYAGARGLSRSLLARAEVDASPMSVETVGRLLEGTGYELVVAPVGGSPDDVEWDRFDLVARTRSGSRFPANRRVKDSPQGPLWFWYHEVLGSRGGGRPVRPEWSAEGFRPPPGTRYGPKPKDTPPGERRWPY